MSLKSSSIRLTPTVPTISFGFLSKVHPKGCDQPAPSTQKKLHPNVLTSKQSRYYSPKIHIRKKETDLELQLEDEQRGIGAGRGIYVKSAHSEQKERKHCWGTKRTIPADHRHHCYLKKKMKANNYARSAFKTL